CNESVRPYSVPRHRHLSEIEQELSLAAGEPLAIQFTPHLIPVSRGILTTLYLAPAKHFGDPAAMSELSKKISACYAAAYGSEPFVRLLDGTSLPDTKNVVGTNVIEIAWRLDPRTGRLIVMSAEDNLVKGASGQAVQSMNILCGLPETAGLVGGETPAPSKAILFFSAPPPHTNPNTPKKPRKFEEEQIPPAPRSITGAGEACAAA